MDTVKLEINGNGHDLSVKEFNGLRVVTFKDIDELHQRTEGTAKRNFIQHKEQLIYGEDYFVISTSQKDEFRTLEIPNRGLTVITESGYLMLVKSLQDDLAWKVQRQLVNQYFRNKQQQQPKSQAELIAMLAQYNVDQERRIQAVEQRVELTEKRQETITEVLSLNPTEWRKKTTSLLNKIAKKLGGFEAYRDIRNQSYEQLEERAKCDLDIRLKNRRSNMALEGASKSKIDKVNKMDVIASDARLTEIYLAIIKEMAIRHNIDANDIQEGA